MNILRMQVDLPPTLNQSYRPARGRFIRLSDQARAYKDMIAWLVKAKRIELAEGKRWYWLRLVQHLKRNSRDVDANIKLVMDGICIGLGIDDRYVKRAILEKEIDGGGYLEIEMGVVDG